MITEDKRFIDIQGILAMSDVHPEDCIKINDLIIELSKENQELNQKYLNAVADYETTMFEKEQLNSLVNSCQEEIRELKKQLEEKENIACNWKDSCLENAGKIEILENQQKKFIEYLEAEINELIKEHGNYVYDNYSEEKGKYDTCIEILQKYKEIIGDKQ